MRKMRAAIWLMFDVMFKLAKFNWALLRSDSYVIVRLSGVNANKPRVEVDWSRNDLIRAKVLLQIAYNNREQLAEEAVFDL
jgi:hypothetical protein